MSDKRLVISTKCGLSARCPQSSDVPTSTRPVRVSNNTIRSGKGQSFCCKFACALFKISSRISAAFCLPTVPIRTPSVLCKIFTSSSVRKFSLSIGLSFVSLTLLSSSTKIMDKCSFFWDGVRKWGCFVGKFLWGRFFDVWAAQCMNVCEYPMVTNCTLLFSPFVI